MSDAERARGIVSDIITMYEERHSQQEVADFVNQKYNSELSANDISTITQQRGYWHTVIRTDKLAVLTFLSDTFKKHVGL